MTEYEARGPLTYEAEVWRRTRAVVDGTGSLGAPDEPGDGQVPGRRIETLPTHVGSYLNRFEKAVIDAANVLGPPKPCPGQTCDGCGFEMIEAVAILYGAVGIPIEDPDRAYRLFEEIRSAALRQP